MIKVRKNSLVIFFKEATVDFESTSIKTLSNTLLPSLALQLFFWNSERNMNFETIKLPLEPVGMRFTRSKGALRGRKEKTPQVYGSKKI